jgi:hypothetical protein
MSHAQLALEFDRFAAAVEAQRAIRVRDRNVDPAQKPRLVGQNAWLVDRLRRGPITPMQAMAENNVMRLAARIGDLKAAGYEIQCTRAANGVATYELIGEGR